MLSEREIPHEDEEGGTEREAQLRILAVAAAQPRARRYAGRTMEAVGAVKLDLETWKKNSAVDLHVLNWCLCRRSGGGEYLLKSTVAYQHRRGVDDAAGNFCRSNRNVMDEPRHGFPLHSARQEAPPPHLNGTIGRVTTKSTILSFLVYNL